MTRSGLALLVACAAALLLVAAPASGRADAAGGCRGSALSGGFTHVPGSDAMGHAQYSLWLTNNSSQTCTVAGRPRLQLLDRDGKPLPTNATPSRAASAVTLSPGGSAEATALVAIDIPGAGDSHRPGGPCQPTAVQLRVGAARETSTIVPVQPPTAVCQSGTISLKPLAALTALMPSGLLATLKTLLRYPPREYTLTVRYDPHDRSWVEWTWGPAGPADPIQGGVGFAHLAGGNWRNIWGPGNPAFCQLGVPTTVPTTVRRAFGITCAKH
ncbi:MAG: DUF4232 domain-containing protein [Gaiellaceae bacterium]|jgi:hypothetical protein